MTTHYIVETDEFGISDMGFHLLRSRYNYQTVYFSDVTSVSIQRGRQVNNWILLFLFGIILFLSGIFWSYKVIYEFFFADNIKRFYAEQFVFPVLPILVGGFSIFMSLKRGLVIVLTTKNKRKTFSIERLRKENKLEDFISILKRNVMTTNKTIIQVKLVNNVWNALN